ncbi:MAG: hypothetical protein A3A96_00935 [Candidatus Zambryskibacteria bacterium RIFCSPLOWO2_01_FULL_39_39]|uniref:Uncharacterized protein n=1 Tax=Candidatus Zambryskibacteria bacterium RIFCSPLOWO2_01_FULL_39_39 TaxID=1802758 RepID=A0A1G2TZ26_9BACT|nr:MAG: hypothetical protein A2644_04450 [Candidatus Zambryskibacteria bacterium RIFCSPHIGHO2_01_FULL_39_63]OHA95091.1 MAG: hypothetical protein A3B88_03355 [Candidatus Zambryskibacteria bacterium RIFCSPHIGHO2_02_FULL_39_19]OHA98211.1 MAG: hypothetical protein A3F20_04165 [Candidatus Zambryskibacteria bacterium RIFCSPHIGHO2_12_FULL_39_21]OHB02423.1 MAG: hypothetical protein A3A96_00935 [Candidatus Zambryskibacteria bacterium RIFCSPLOWO2_01_FULL_39_39]
MLSGKRELLAFARRPQFCNHILVKIECEQNWVMLFSSLLLSFSLLPFYLCSSPAKTRSE